VGSTTAENTPLRGALVVSLAATFHGALRMSMEPNADYESLGKTRTQHFQQWRFGHAHNFRSWRKDVIGRFTQRGWLETEARVTSCKPAMPRYPFPRQTGTPIMIGGWAVGFVYDVDGRPYDGIALSKDKLEKGDRFAIRFNPERPEENNSLATKLDWIDGTIMGVYDIFLLLLLGGLTVAGMFLYR
jgi:hypothetical protein